MGGVAASVRLRMAVDKGVRVVGISLVRVEHGREASRHECRNYEASKERPPRELHVSSDYGCNQKEPSSRRRFGRDIFQM
jgi:hypothetical protein